MLQKRTFLSLPLRFLVLSLLVTAGFATAAEDITTTNRLYVHVEGMQSEHCEMLLEETLMNRLEDVEDLDADYESGWVWIEIDPSEDAEKRIRETVESGCSFKVTEVRRDPPASMTAGGMPEDS